MKNAHGKVFNAAILLTGLLLAGCSRKAPQGDEPGLGEIMSLQQMRHAKVWYAGQAQNWPLAAYELDELREGFDDVVQYHPTHKDSPLPLSQVVPKIMGEPLQALDHAIRAHDSQAFVAAFDGVTAGCNHCHQATNFGFNVVRRPAAPGYSNQDFNPPAAGPR
jgi:hypothetical protein